MARRRHLSRIAVMQVLFERERRPTIDPEVSLQRNATDLEAMDTAFADRLLKGVLAHEAELKSIIEEHAPSWTYDRMDPISRCALLIGAFELRYHQDAPPPVVMNEAIEIAKEYGTEESGKFVNGVLNAMAQARPQEPHFKNQML